MFISGSCVSPSRFAKNLGGRLKTSSTFIIMLRTTPEQNKKVSVEKERDINSTDLKAQLSFLKALCEYNMINCV